MRNSDGWSLYSNSWYFRGFVYIEVFGAANSSGILILSLSTWQIRNIKEMGARAFLCMAGRSSRRSNLAGMYVENLRTYFAISMPQKIVYCKLRLLVAANPEPVGRLVYVRAVALHEYEHELLEVRVLECG